MFMVGTAKALAAAMVLAAARIERKPIVCIEGTDEMCFEPLCGIFRKKPWLRKENKRKISFNLPLQFRYMNSTVQCSCCYLPAVGRVQFSVMYSSARFTSVHGMAQAIISAISKPQPDIVPKQQQESDELLLCRYV